MRIRTVITLCVMTAAAVAQPLADGRFAAGRGSLGPREGAANLNAITTYLSLTTSQIQSIQSIVRQAQPSIQNLQQQIQKNMQTIRTMLLQGSTDTQTLGTLLLSIGNLRKQMQHTLGGIQSQTQNVLTADQMTKLGALQAALNLEPAAREAMLLHLLVPPAGVAGSLRPAFRVPEDQPF